jgi:RNA recognition motif-containing protein
VQDVRIIKDTQSRKSKGIAYVEFEKQEQVVAALAKSGQTLCGFPIVVQASQAEKNQVICVYIHTCAYIHTYVCQKPLTTCIRE